ncbi:uncharacterized protein UHO2_03439 [Ustilago hordei]|uniref:Uncharacterized protein n=1 Tax=Ustilago hordei TaxID=120017 RepID=I2G1G2_USTHO|nr:uncharacterized protein UHO2_03439 [Ustilago hordei]CCF53005.1 uncharacterized protein UHOR_15779 [Ustilago hordei]SYW84242.1 uncharacterized protein UHO2_03439 [Ustilago hordei]
MSLFAPLSELALLHQSFGIRAADIGAAHETISVQPDSSTSLGIAAAAQSLNADSDLAFWV